MTLADKAIALASPRAVEEAVRFRSTVAALVPIRRRLRDVEDDLWDRVA
jgi:hypothetical protein